jgi:shikimate kinase / 3-dehydroquinate synthase
LNDNLILAGFMGTGKTTVGRLCAHRLGYDFVDADVEIEMRAGLSIPRIFEQQGEAYFRALETALVQELVQRERAVIATGGGMIVDQANRRALLNAGVAVGLTAAPDAILRRVDASTRPMLRGDDPCVRVASLLKERAPAYRELHYTVDTTARTPDEAADCICALYAAERRRIAVKTPGASEGARGGDHYDIVIGENVLDQIGFALAGRGWSAPFAIVSDERVAPHYAGRVRQSLARAGIASFVHTMPAGESAKHLRTVEDMYRAFSEHGLERNGAVIAVGGGVVGDATGFAAATYLRGVPFVQVPTSLLAMADSSVGGKVGVDTSFGKNLVGAFKQPELVVMDVGCLRTLPPVELRCGYAEIVKAALIAGGDAYGRVCAGVQMGGSKDMDSALMATLIDAIELKRNVVEEDPFEQGRRALLNLGHTFGHGVEAWSRFAIKHGEAVALGMLCAARASHALGWCSEALVRDVMALLSAAGLPTSLRDFAPGGESGDNARELPAFDVDQVWQLMQSDKKKRSGRLRFVMLRGPGDCFVTDAVDEAQARQALVQLRGG